MTAPPQQLSLTSVSLCPQPACAITGEGLDDALEHLYDMIHKQRRLAKTNKKRPR